MFSRLFFDELHCQAPPVSTSDSSATNATIERPAIKIGRRWDFFFGVPAVDALAGEVARRRFRCDVFAGSVSSEASSG